MKFSIIIPVYNVEDYLDECVKSVLDQIYKEFEIILVDDGSTDGSGFLCDCYSQKYPNKIVTFHLQNGGALLARQYGIIHSTGDALVFLDSDDCLRKDALDKLARSFVRHGCDMILYNLSKNADYSTSDSKYPFKDEDQITEKSDVLRALVSGQMPNGVVTKSVLRSCAEKLPDVYKFAHVKNGEDLLLSIYLITNAKKVLYLDEILYFYRQRTESTVHSFNPQIAESIKAVHKEMEKYVDIWGIPELHPAQYARAVWGWTDILKNLLDNRQNMKKRAFRGELRDIIDDDFFRKAYESMDPDVLSNRQKQMAKWLYEKKYIHLNAFSVLLNIRKRLIKIIK